MTLTVEDGTGVANADSYVSQSDAVSWLAKRGLTLTGVTASDEVLLIKAMDFLESLRDQYQGRQVDSTQALQWPRVGVYRDGALVASDEIPDILWQAQARLAVYAKTIDLMPSGDGRAIMSETVGPISHSFATDTSANPQPSLTEARALYAPLLKAHAGVGGLITERA